MPKKEPIRKIITSVSTTITKNEIKVLKSELTQLLVKTILKQEHNLKHKRY
jgi:hypothetical protein